LVVIGVIAILLALLLPVLIGSRRSANQLRCASNLAQLGIAMHAYATDHQQALPYGACCSRTTGFPDRNDWIVSWDDLINPYVGKTLTESEKEAPFSYKDTKVVRCPSDMIAPTHTEPGIFRRSYSMPGLLTGHHPSSWIPAGGIGILVLERFSHRPHQRLSWGGVGLLLQQWHDPSLSSSMPNDLVVKLGSVRRPSEVLLLVEGNSGWNVQGHHVWAIVDNPMYCYHAYRQTGAPPTLALARRTSHRDKWNYLFVDGHVASMRLEDTLRRKPDGSVDLSKGSHLWTRDPND
jgi:prepilin-type processing-associated H-X9-DG protein